MLEFKENFLGIKAKIKNLKVGIYFLNDGTTVCLKTNQEKRGTDLISYVVMGSLDNSVPARTGQLCALHEDKLVIPIALTGTVNVVAIT